MGETAPNQSKEKSIKEHLEGGWASKVLEWLKEDGGKNLLLVGLTIPLVNLIAGGAPFEWASEAFDSMAEFGEHSLDAVEEGSRAVLEKLGGFTSNLAEEPSSP